MNVMLLFIFVYEFATVPKLFLLLGFPLYDIFAQTSLSNICSIFGKKMLILTIFILKRPGA